MGPCSACAPLRTGAGTWGHSAPWGLDKWCFWIRGSGQPCVVCLTVHWALGHTSLHWSSGHPARPQPPGEMGPEFPLVAALRGLQDLSFLTRD